MPRTAGRVVVWVLVAAVGLTACGTDVQELTEQAQRAAAPPAAPTKDPGAAAPAPTEMAPEEVMGEALEGLPAEPIDDVCGLLTTDEVEQIVGYELGEPLAATDTCTWQAAAQDGRSVAITVGQGDPGGIAFGFLRETFGEFGSIEEVSGVGEEAFFVFGGIIGAFAARSSDQFALSVMGGLNLDPGQTQAASRELVSQLLDRM